MKLVALLSLPCVVLVTAGCGGSSSSSSVAHSSPPAPSGGAPAPSRAHSTPVPSRSPGAPITASISVGMKNLAFVPSAITGKVGQTVLFTNDDSAPHNVTYVSGPKFASSQTLNTGAKFTLKLTAAGTIHYFCSIHPFMKATIVVAK